MTIDELETMRFARLSCLDGTARRLRIEQCHSMQEIADYLGVTASAVSMWETGARMPRSKTALHYGQLLLLWSTSNQNHQPKGKS